jgi:hypothetical protein
MSFRSVFIAVTISFALILGAFLVNRARPRVETEQPTADFVRAGGKCAECHARLQYFVVHEYEMSAHAKTRRYLDLCLAVLGVQALVGIVGFWLHIRMSAYTPGTSLFERTIYGHRRWRHSCSRTLWAWR